MKKLSVVLILGALVMMGCEVASYSVSVGNDSKVGLKVTYSYNGETRTLSKGDEPHTYIVAPHTLPPVVIHPVPDDFKSPPKDPETDKPYPRYVRVVSLDGGLTYTFEDIKDAAKAALDEGANNLH